MNRIAITGSSGYFVSRLVEHFRGLVAAILGIDVQPPHADAAAQPYEFSGLDVCDESVGAPFRPDTIIHGAFAFRPLRDEEQIRYYDVGISHGYNYYLTRLRYANSFEQSTTSL